MNAKHTPTPYAYGPISGHIYAIKSGVHIATMEGVCDQGPGPYRDRSLINANAAFIVRAVNSHDALVEALEKLLRIESLRTIITGTTVLADAVINARAALAAAKGEV